MIGLMKLTVSCFYWKMSKKKPFDLTEAILTILSVHPAFLNDEARENLWKAYGKYPILFKFLALISGSGVKSLKRLYNPDYIVPKGDGLCDPEYIAFLQRVFPNRHYS